MTDRVSKELLKEYAEKLELAKYELRKACNLLLSASMNGVTETWQVDYSHYIKYLKSFNKI